MPIPTVVYIIKGMALVRKLKVDHFSFVEIPDTELARVGREGGSSISIDVVFDDNMNLSIKLAERGERGQGD